MTGCNSAFTRQAARFPAPLAFLAPTRPAIQWSASELGAARHSFLNIPQSLERPYG